MSKDLDVVGYLLEFHPQSEQTDEITLDDLNTSAPDKLRLLSEWASGLAHPWSDSAMSYVINCIDYLNVDEDHKWKAVFSSVFYDYLESQAIGYGKTPEEALSNVQTLVKDVIEKLAIKDEE